MAQIKIVILLALRLVVLQSLVSAIKDEVAAVDIKEENTNLTASGSANVLENLNSLDFSQAAAVEIDQPIHQPKLVGQFSANRRGRKVAPAKRRRKSPLADVMLNLLNEFENLGLEKRSRSNGNQTAAKQRIASASAIGADTKNLLSITKEIMKLARFGDGLTSSVRMGVDEFGSAAAPMLMSPLLSAASHLFHDTSDPYALAKSDWFWVVAPAVIVIGAGVIVVPLIAAWIISHMMQQQQQNTFSLSTGRRRKRAASWHSHDLNRSLLDAHKYLAGPDADLLLAKKLVELYGRIMEQKY